MTVRASKPFPHAVKGITTDAPRPQRPLTLKRGQGARHMRCDTSLPVRRSSSSRTTLARACGPSTGRRGL